MTQTKDNRVTTREADGTWNRNEVTFMGNLGRDPEMSYTRSGKAVTKFSMAVWQGKDKDSMWLNVVCWEDLAEQINGQVKKGSCVEVRGRLTQRKYQDKYYHDVVVDSIEIIEKAGSKGKKTVSDDDRDSLGEISDHPF